MRRAALGAAPLLAWVLPALAAAQLAVRPGSTRDHPHERPWDVSGRSLKAPRLRALHDDGTVPGGSVWLMRHDPFVAFAIGRDLNLRDWQLRDGVFGESGRVVGFTRPRVAGGGGGGVATRDDTASCAICHAIPFGEPGAGITIPKDSGTGRNTPHLYGGGLQEMIGERIRAEILASCDAGRDGRIQPAEAKGRRASVRTGAGATLDFGPCGDENGDGIPDVNGQVRAFYLDEAGKWVSWATSLGTAGVAAWSPEPQVFGHGQTDGGLTATLRAFFVAAADVHSGLQANDPLLVDDPDQDGLSQKSPVGTQQYVTVRPRDRGRVLSAAGVSRDDPDRDGFIEELSCGDVDLAEFFLFHMPPPIERPGARAASGRQVFERIGCAGCHVPDWQIDQDRRLFRLDVAEKGGELQGKLVWSSRTTGKDGARTPLSQPYTVRGVYSDFRKHDMGDRFAELGFDGTITRRWRTAPLWGVGSSAPYGHDGASLALEEVIDRHGGEAEEAAKAWRALEEGPREAVLAFLRSLVLYPVVGLPSDVDGDGRIADPWMVSGRTTGGRERFDPELLSAVPCELEGDTRGYSGAAIFSKACVNVAALYRMDLRARADRDADGFPDVRDDCPREHGLLDGCRDPPNYTGE
ncbi:MAG TPA: di-heme oxidoredictase family protein [Myxococcales bacterium]|nr:di-heme oxidoredictase family protein [Myxococcales bacterium]